MIDRFIRITTALAVVAVAGVAKVFYRHAYELVTSHGETGLTARLMPFTGDDRLARTTRGPDRAVSGPDDPNPPRRRPQPTLNSRDLNINRRKVKQKINKPGRTVLDGPAYLVSLIRRMQ